jgi:hypothetical protein
VNTASRMESQGLRGQIQVTDRVAAALGSGFVLRPHGTSEVKGKGPMTTFLGTENKRTPLMNAGPKSRSQREIEASAPVSLIRATTATISAPGT